MCSLRNPEPGGLYYTVARDSSALSMKIREITLTRLHYGYRRVHVQLQREGWRDNHKRVYRLYRDQGLSLRLKRPRRNKAAKNRQPLQQANHPNHIWGMDLSRMRFLMDEGYAC